MAGVRLADRDAWAGQDFNLAVRIGDGRGMASGRSRSGVPVVRDAGFTSGTG